LRPVCVQRGLVGEARARTAGSGAGRGDMGLVLSRVDETERWRGVRRPDRARAARECLGAGGLPAHAAEPVAQQTIGGAVSGGARHGFPVSKVHCFCAMLIVTGSAWLRSHQFPIVAKLVMTRCRCRFPARRAPREPMARTGRM